FCSSHLERTAKHALLRCPPIPRQLPNPLAWPNKSNLRQSEVVRPLLAPGVPIRKKAVVANERDSKRPAAMRRLRLAAHASQARLPGKAATQPRTTLGTAGEQIGNHRPCSGTGRANGVSPNNPQQPANSVRTLNTLGFEASWCIPKLLLAVH